MSVECWWVVGFSRILCNSVALLIAVVILSVSLTHAERHGQGFHIACDTGDHCFAESGDCWLRWSGSWKTQLLVSATVTISVIIFCQSWSIQFSQLATRREKYKVLTRSLAHNDDQPPSSKTPVNLLSWTNCSQGRAARHKQGLVMVCLVTPPPFSILILTVVGSTI